MSFEPVDYPAQSGGAHCAAGEAVPLCDSGGEPSAIPWTFVRQSVYRPAFDAQTSITLASVEPARIVDIDVMHPQRGSGSTHWQGSPEGFCISGEDAECGRWMYALNPYACHELLPVEVPQGAELFWLAVNPVAGLLLAVRLRQSAAHVWEISITAERHGKTVLEQRAHWAAESASRLERVILQGHGCGMNVYCQCAGNLPALVLTGDFPACIDLRKRSLCAQTEVRVGALASAASPVRLRSVRQFLSAGVGIADLRPVTLPDASPLLEGGRVFVTASLRGRGLQHPLQGVLSFNPSLCDLRLEGVLVFDREDGYWRNEIASHLIYDPRKKTWFGLTTGFSAFGDSPPGKKQIYAFRCSGDPRFGFSVAKATPTGLAGDYEDPVLFRDTEQDCWRLALCAHNGTCYQTVLMESDRPDGGFTIVSAPPGPDATGIQTIVVNAVRYLLFGSDGRRLWVADYPTLRVREELSVPLPPWSDTTGTRVWPAVIPLPEDSFAPAVMVTMDRVNYPGMPAPNWTYGAVYFYFAEPVDKSQQQE